MSTLIVASHLTRKFGSFTAVDDLCFELPAGQVIGYLGPNGSGKTTTIRMLLGLLRPTSGTASVLGYNCAVDSERVRAISGYMSQKFALYQELTGRENLAFYAGVYGITDRASVEHTLALLGLEAIAGVKVQDLSAGWKQRLALATAIVHRPRLLFLDEPTSGVDPVARRNFWDLIYTLADQGISVLVTTHYMDEAEYCSRVGIMRTGRLLALDTPANLKAALPGRVWQLEVEPLLPAFDALSRLPDVLRVGLQGNALRAVTANGAGADLLQSGLQQAGIQVSSITPAAPSLEDVFLTLAGKTSAPSSG